MTAIILFSLLVLTIAFYAIYKADMSHSMRLQNNDTTADRCRNLAIISGILCIILIVSAIANKDEFLSNNQFNNCPMRKEINATTPRASLGQYMNMVQPSQGLILSQSKS